MNAHDEAWNKVKQHIFGETLEISRTTPWGFYMHEYKITNKTVKEYLEEPMRYDTIILHILQGEGEPKEVVKEVINKAKNECIKIIILEHNYESKDFYGLSDTSWIKKELEPNIVVEDNWGRNLLYTCTTTHPLVLNQLNNEYYEANINKTFVVKGDEGINEEHLIYTHTSEEPVSFDLPRGIIRWVIGGGLCYECLSPNNFNYLFDSVLRQVLYCAKLFGVTPWKIRRLYDFGELIVGSDYKQWRVVKSNGVKPDVITHHSLQELRCSDDTVYVSTVHKDYWLHLEEHNDIIDAWTKRDMPLLRKSTKQSKKQ
jgi:hypothetical protein